MDLDDVKALAVADVRAQAERDLGLEGDYLVAALVRRAREAKAHARKVDRDHRTLVEAHTALRGKWQRLGRLLRANGHECDEVLEATGS